MKEFQGLVRTFSGSGLKLRKGCLTASLPSTTTTFLSNAVSGRRKSIAKKVTANISPHLDPCSFYLIPPNKIAVNHAGQSTETNATKPPGKGPITVPISMAVRVSPVSWYLGARPLTQTPNANLLSSFVLKVEVVYDHETHSGSRRDCKALDESGGHVPSIRL